jgi:hypothetical protein
MGPAAGAWSGGTEAFVQFWRQQLGQEPEIVEMPPLAQATPPPDTFVCHRLLLAFGGSLANPPLPGEKPTIGEGKAREHTVVGETQTSPPACKALPVPMGS